MSAIAEELLTINNPMTDRFIAPSLASASSADDTRDTDPYRFNAVGGAVPGLLFNRRDV